MFVGIAGHPGRHVIENFQRTSTVVRRGVATGLVFRQAAPIAAVVLQIHLPAQPRHEILVRFASRCIAQYRILVFLAGGHVENGEFVRFTTAKKTQIQYA